MLKANSEVGCYQRHNAQSVNRGQNIIEDALRCESEAGPNNSRLVRWGENGFVTKQQKRASDREKWLTFAREKERGARRGRGERDIKHSGSLSDYNDATRHDAPAAAGIVDNLAANTEVCAHVRGPGLCLQGVDIGLLCCRCLSGRAGCVG